MITKDTIRALGVFANSQQIEQAISELKTANFPMEKVSVIAKDVEQGDRVGEAQISDRIGNQDVNTTGAVGETLTATTWGSALLGLSSLALPGLGAVLAAGSVGVALVSSVAGVAVGAAANQNLLKALGDLGIPEEKARVYSDRLQQSYYLLILEGSEEEIHRVEPKLRDRGIEYWGVYDSAHTQNGGVH
ncbi:general stress protein [Nostoc sp. UCD121]|uniref:general stress protein n=1 Tax=unclassified Nostoc TaxID=2593658 RepID=UPI0016237EDF|nr:MULTISPECIES: general stress protein [unclassified Nostoc]MBC1220114.1 general stress protein [Nostoc sp. UCD120]MBC1276703.1 general stress protein [Nostoc sp. UCD121]MBC1298742.1 general stress protein [Nostoc sp. UCD122]